MRLLTAILQELEVQKYADRSSKRDSARRPIQSGTDVVRSHHVVGSAQQFPDSEKAASQHEPISDTLSIW
jgi:histone acetyltransferase (RNA polymerase elongator complex component)